MVDPLSSDSLAFTPVTNLSSGGVKPGSLVLADFNGDGKLDVAVSNYTSNTISVFLNKGDGTFQAPIVSPIQITAVGLGPIAAGDFNEDGKPDLVVATIAGSQASIVLLGNGDGTFRELTPIPNSFGFFQAIAVDLNGDGHQDLVTGGENAISISLGHGDGTFAAPTQLPLPGVPTGITFALFLSTVVGDFNGDNKLDIVSAENPENALVFYAGNGDGTFQSPTTVAVGTATSFAGGDFNGDGKKDILIGFAASAVTASGNGNGTFQLGLGAETLVYSAGLAVPISQLQNSSTFVQAADLNRDGKLDAVVTNYYTGTLNLVLNDAFGNPTAATGIYQFALAPGAFNTVVGDLNGDGLPDIVVANSTTNQISVVLSQKR